MKKTLLISILLHLALLIVVAGGKGKGTGVFGSDDVDITPKAIDVVEYSPVDVAGTEPQPKKKDVKCKDWYGGVGLNYSVDAALGENTIVATIVPEGYPAWSVGIRPGDVLKFEKDLRGDPGTETSATVYHKDGSVSEVKMIREKICTEKVENPRP